MTQSRPVYAGLLIAILLASAALHHWNPAPVQRLRALAFDTYQRLSPRTFDPALPVRIVDIDEASLAAQGQWPWPRTDIAMLIERLEAMGAVAIVFDMVFAEPDRLSPDALAKRFAHDPALSGAAEALAMQRSNDQVLAEVIARSGVVLGFVGAQAGQAEAPPPLAAEIEYKGDDPRLFVPPFPSAVVNLPELTARAPGSGFINWIAEQDQIIRRLPLLIRIGDTLYPSIAAEGLRLAQGVSNYLVVASGEGGATSFGTRTGISRVFIGNAVVPTDAQGQMWLRFTHSDPRRYVSAKAIFDGTAAADEIKGKIVLVGTSAAGLLDVRATPLDPAIPGVEAHAQAVEQMLLGEHLTRPDFATGAEIIFTIAVGGLLAWAVYRSGAAIGLVLSAAAISSVLGASWIAFSRSGWLLDPVYPSLTLAVVFIAGSSFLRLRTEVERNRIRHAFGHYMSPAQVEKLASDPTKLELGGENRNLTVLFADVRGFTTRSEGLDAQALTRFVIELFTPLSNTIIASNGTIDKFIGDAVMAFWNAPLDDPDHAANACRAALKMLRDLDSLNRNWNQGNAGAKPVSIGIGLNTGICCVGNFGSAQRFDYSAIGNDVNLASRFESLTKYYGVPVLAGQRTAEAAPELALLEIDLISVKGYELPVRVFALLGDESVARSEAFHRLRKLQDALIEAYRGRRFDEAMAIVSQLRKAATPSLTTVWNIYEERIAGHRLQPPAPDWDGRAIALGK